MDNFLLNNTFELNIWIIKGKQQMIPRKFPLIIMYGFMLQCVSIDITNVNLLNVVIGAITRQSERHYSVVVKSIE